MLCLHDPWILFMKQVHCNDIWLCERFNGFLHDKQLHKYIYKTYVFPLISKEQGRKCSFISIYFITIIFFRSLTNRHLYHLCLMLTLNSALLQYDIQHNTKFC